MKKLFLLVVLALTLSACGPTPAAEPVPTQPPTVLVYPRVSYSLRGPIEPAIMLPKPDSERLITGRFDNVKMDCENGVLEVNDRVLILLDSVQWLAVEHPVEDIIDPPGTSSYSWLYLIGSGLGIFSDFQKENAIEFASGSMTVGPCGLLVVNGWLYEDVDNYHKLMQPEEIEAVERRHNQASLEGEFLVNPKNLLYWNEISMPTVAYSGNEWATTTIDWNFMVAKYSSDIFHHPQYPNPITCNGESQPAWSSVVSVDAWKIQYDDSQQVGSGWRGSSDRMTVVPMWGKSYPPQYTTTILGNGFTSDYSYVLLSIPEGCINSIK
ncbi:hypothetical protein AUJ42_01525 [Candidatus Collierbacteria bacterium CG1_02_44_10]|uniref:Uncharacterized protein n=2 Tax=Candidatus Collieribacteriota TaxID=1752725 RepID=A0A2H0VNM3_9BACT|nr:MAG: hypothetical protein AUJ42_01525 [Candidatus Collierbacteria bacterium CG1_02_44_10]PIR99959.1 MAG: hypothetical protein COT86_01095 [Candidatus Collierbacteria bacterium CG10_big_fil_rev_8_21_14_0_10_43_36]